MCIRICFVCTSVKTTATEWNWIVVSNSNSNSNFNLVNIDILSELLESRFYVYSCLFILY